MTAPNVEHIRTVKYHVHFLLQGLPELRTPITYEEISIALGELQKDYADIFAQKQSEHLAA